MIFPLLISNENKNFGTSGTILSGIIVKYEREIFQITNVHVRIAEQEMLVFRKIWVRMKLLIPYMHSKKGEVFH